MKKILAIIGSYTPTRTAFNFARQDCDIWVFNEAVAAAWCQRADVVFQLHDRVIWSNPLNRNDPNHVLWMKNITAQCNACGGKGCPACVNGMYTPKVGRLDTVVYMQAEEADVPMSKAYPLEGVKNLFGGDHFLSSSVSMALALALYVGQYSNIEIYGVGMKTNTEYQFQREGVAYWLGCLKGVGINVHFEGDSFACPVYGFDGAAVIPYERFGERIAVLQIEIDKLMNQYGELRLAIHKQINAMETGAGQTAQADMMKDVEKISELTASLGMLCGAEQENIRYQKRADAMIETGEKFIFARQEFESSAHNAQKALVEIETQYISIATTLGHIERNALQAAKASPKRKNLFELYRKTMDQYLDADRRRAFFRGVLSENQGYMNYLDSRITAAGGSKSEAVMLEALQNELV